MIIDTFILGLESDLDLLDIRLNYLDDIVDLFVLIEAEETHSGKPKSKFYLENEKRFKNFKNKIVSGTADLSAFSKAKEKEDQQRNYINPILKTLGLSNNATILLSDIDEIPNKNRLSFLKNSWLENEMSFRHRFFSYFLNLEAKDKNWIGTVAAPYWQVKKYPIQRLRDLKDYFPILGLQDSFHFSYLGGAEGVWNKLNAFSHTENEYKNLSKDEFKELFLKRVIQDKQFDLGNDSIPLTQVNLDQSFPEYLLENRQKYKHLILG